MASQNLWRRIKSDETYAAAAVFAFVHRECGEAVRVDRGERLLACWCALCEDTRTYEVDENHV